MPNVTDAPYQITSTHTISIPDSPSVPISRAEGVGVGKTYIDNSQQDKEFQLWNIQNEDIPELITFLAPLKQGRPHINVIFHKNMKAQNLLLDSGS